MDKEEDYAMWYGLDYHDPALHKESVYGLPELFRDDIKREKNQLGIQAVIQQVWHLA